jgi:hypothetical protein
MPKRRKRQRTEMEWRMQTTRIRTRTLLTAPSRCTPSPDKLAPQESVLLLLLLIPHDMECTAHHGGWRNGHGIPGQYIPIVSGG